MSTRREFLQSVVGGGLALSAAQLPWLSACSHEAHETEDRMPLVLPGRFTGGTLVASVLPDIHKGIGTQPWTFGGSAPAPTIRVRKGDAFSAQLVNQLAEPTNVHWQGVLVPADSVSMRSSPRTNASCSRSSATAWSPTRRIRNARNSRWFAARVATTS